MKTKIHEPLSGGKRQLLLVLGSALGGAILTAFLFFLFRGIPLFGLPKASEVDTVLVQCTSSDHSNQLEREFQDEEKIRLALNLCSSLSWTPGAVEEGEALFTYTFEKKDGGSVSLGVNKDAIFLNGRAYRRKNCDDRFQKLSAVLFFLDRETASPEASPNPPAGKEG